MAKPLVVILSGRSLFAEGVASRLKDYPQEVELKIVNAEDPELLNHIQALRPVAIILDPADSETQDFCPLAKLFLELQNLKIIQLDSQKRQIQILSSTLQEAFEVQDLLAILA